MSDDDPFAEDRWELDLADTLTEHGVDSYAGVGADVLAQHLALVTGSLVRLLKIRDRESAPKPPLGLEERVELETLRLRVKELEADLKIRRQNVDDLVIQLEDAKKQRDRALRTISAIRGATADSEVHLLGWPSESPLQHP